MTIPPISAPSPTPYIIEIDPRDVTLVKKKTHHLYDPRVNLPVDKKSEESPYPKLKKFGWTHGFLHLVEEEIGGVVYRVCVDGKQRTNALLLLNKEREAEGLPPIMARAYVATRTTPTSEFLIMWGANHGARKNTSLVDSQMIQALVSLSMNAVPPEEQAKAKQEAFSQAAVILGCSKDTVQNRMRLLGLAGPVRDALAKGEITDSDALKIVGQGATVRSEEEQVDLLKKTPKAAGPGKRRRKDAPTPGKRGAPKRPSVRALQKVLDAVGDGAAEAPTLRFAAGLISQSAYFKILKLPEPGAKVRVKGAK